MSEIEIRKITDYLWEIPKQGRMNVPGRVYASELLMNDIKNDQSLQQVVNVAHLPGILRYSMAMPDIHWGYGFPIGGVAAFDLKEGIISPGGVGYDINCGVRLLKTALSKKDINKKTDDLIRAIFSRVPSGVGSKGSIRLNLKEEKQVLTKGALWAVEQGYGNQEDLLYIEENGRMENANPSRISQEAYRRGRPQLGTLGSGNHFIELDYVKEIFDSEAAKVMGLEKDQVVVMIHTGSRGFGYQVCDDYIRKMIKAAEKYGIELPDRQLCCAPFESPEGQEYFEAMNCAINYAFANRQIIAHWVNLAFQKVLGLSPKDTNVQIVYELAHNIAKIETHIIDGKSKKVIVHRKGATRSFGPGQQDVPDRYRHIGQPVIIPGDMGRYSYVLTGKNRSMEESFGSTCHGAGRRLSRKKAKKIAGGREIIRDLEKRGIKVMAASRATLIEEIPEAYKDVSDVVSAVHNADIAGKAVKLCPMGVIKG